MNKRSFTQKEVVVVTGVNPGTLQVWLRDTLIVPSIENPKGRGTTRRYSSGDLTMIRIVSILSQFTYNRVLIKNFVETFNENGIIMRAAKMKKPPKAIKGVLDMFDPLEAHKGRIVLKCSGDKWEVGPGPMATDLFQGNLTTLLIDVTKIMEDLKKRIDKVEH